MQTIPRIQTQRLLLRAIHRSDAESVFRLFSDPQVIQFYDIDALPTVAAALRIIDGFTARFQNNEAIRWGIFLRDQQEMIGSCCFEKIHQRFQRVNLGYNLRSDHWGGGLATEACQAIVQLAFAGRLGFAVNRIQAITVPENIQSESLLVRLGFKPEGLMRNYAFWKGQSRDMQMHGLIKSDFTDTTE